MEGLDLGQTSNPSLAWKNGRLKINDDDDDDFKFLAYLLKSVSTTTDRWQQRFYIYFI